MDNRLNDMQSERFGNRYQPIRLLGKKAGRQTWLAQDLQTQQQVVVKLLTFSQNFQWEDLKLFEREAETLKVLAHPAIPRYLDYFDNDKGFALVQTYISARSLDQYIKAGRTFSETEVKQIAMDLLDILDYLHARNPPVIHRDIKPSNILLTNRSAYRVGNLYLVDFGSVQTRVREAGTVTIVGTYGYMPPEQFRGQASPASDLYGLGATLIYLVTGQDPANLMHDDWQIELEPTANLSEDLVDWLQWMTQPDRRQRLASAKDAKRALEQPRNRPVQQVNMPPQRSPVLMKGKPMKTELSVHRSADVLKIIIPSIEYGGCWFLVTLMAWIFFSFHLLYVLPLVWSITVFFIVPISVWMATEPFRSRNIQTCIRIDRDLIQVFRSVDSGKARCIFLADRRTIDKIAYTKRLYHQQSEDGIVEVPPELRIWMNYNSYRVGQLPKASIDTAFRGKLTRRELDWLAQELSDFLGLPITEE